MSNNAIHPFEAAGLGKAPFHFVGMRENWHVSAPGSLMAHRQPGGTCAYCCNGIAYEYWVADNQGARFAVGCDCASKIDAQLSIEIEKIERARKEEAAKARKASMLASLDEALADDSICDILTAQPHPKEWAAAQGMTRLDWADWMRANAGAKGRSEVLRYIKRQVGA